MDKKQLNDLSDSPLILVPLNFQTSVGRISKDIWMTYFRANGGLSFWVMFAAAFILAMFTPLLESLCEDRAFLLILAHNADVSTRWRRASPLDRKLQERE